MRREQGDGALAGGEPARAAPGGPPPSPAKNYATSRGGSDLQGTKKRKREHAEGKSKPRPQVKVGGIGAKRKRHSAAGSYAAHGGASEAVARKKTPVTPKEKRLAAKEMSQTRKMKKKRHHSLEKKLWEKIRCHDVSKEERSKVVSEAIKKMDGKYLDIATSHITARVLQTCVKWCSQSLRDAIFYVLKPELLNLSRKKYAVFLVKKLILVLGLGMGMTCAQIISGGNVVSLPASGQGVSTMTGPLQQELYYFSWFTVTFCVCVANLFEREYLFRQSPLVKNKKNECTKLAKDRTKKDLQIKTKETEIQNLKKLMCKYRWFQELIILR